MSSTTSTSSVIPMNSAEIIAFYTADLVIGRNPDKALDRLYTIGTTMKPFIDAGTEQLLDKYDNEYSCRHPLQKLREKFDTLRRREAREKKFEQKTVIEKQESEESMSQQTTNNLFTTALKQVSTKKTVVKRVDYSKFKIVKRDKKVSKQPQTETPKIRSDKPKLRSFSFSSSVYSWSSSESSPDYQ